MQLVNGGVKRLRLLTACVASAALTAPAALAHSSPHARPAALAPAASLSGLMCIHNLDPAGRQVDITAAMRPIPGSKAMQLNAQLLERAVGTSQWSVVQAPSSKLGTWLPAPKPSLTFQVADLQGPATYRFQITFRWLGDHGRVLRLVTRISAPCFQPEPRPDLTVNSIAVAPNPNHPAVDLFTIVVGNLGLTGAHGFNLVLGWTAGGVQQTKELTGLQIARGPQVTQTYVPRGPACDAGTAVTASVNTTGAVDVYSTSQATLTVTCPPPPPGG